jgi:hypothetical protein
MKTTMQFTSAELGILLIAVNTEQAKQMQDGNPQMRKATTELRDRLAAAVRRVVDGTSAPLPWATQLAPHVVDGDDMNRAARVAKALG